MAFCPNCGAAVEGRFCPKCGTAMNVASTGAAAPDPAFATGSTVPPAAATTVSSGISENVAGALCYLFTVITGILFLVIEPYNRNRNIRFHAFQAIFFFAATIVGWILVMILSAVLHFIPILGTIIVLLLMFALGIGFFICWLLLMYKAFNNERFVLPIIGPLAEKQAMG